MKSMNILEAMNDIDIRFIVSAQKRMGYDISESINPDAYIQKKVNLKKTALLIAAAVLLITACITTALAVNPQLREKMFRFFHIEQEQVIDKNNINTEISEDNMFAEKTIVLDDAVEGKYIHMPVATRASGGVYLVCTDAVEMKQGSHYDAYYEQNGEFIKLEEHRFKEDYVLFDRNIHVEFDWAEHNGNVHITWAEENTVFQKPNLSGGASSLMINLNIIKKDEEGKYTETLYPVLLNLYTGEMTDVLEEIGVGKMECITNSYISDDRTKMLLLENGDDGCFIYYADLISKKLYSLDELSGEHIDACSLIENTLACWSINDGYCKVWNINLKTFELTQLFSAVIGTAQSAIPGIVFISGFDSLQHWEYMYSGSSFALSVDSDKKVYAVDLLSGEKMKIEGYKWSYHTKCIPNSDGTKLLLIDGPDGEDVEYIGVLDYKNMNFVEFDRKNLNAVSEHLTYWFDDDTVIVSSYSDLSKDICLYSLIEKQ